jgi:hypothetical protein
MPRMSVALLAIGLGSLGCAGRVTTLREGDPARALVDSALAHHGGWDRLDRLGTVEFRLTGDRVMIDQSRRADPPWDREPSQVWFIRDAARGRWFWQSTNSYPGIGPFGMRRVLGDGRWFELDPLGDGHGTEVMPLSAADTLDTRRELTRFVPGLLLQVARESADGPRLVARHRTDGASVAVVTFQDQQDRNVQLLIDEDRYDLLGFVHRRSDPVYGVVVDSVAYHGYRAVEGMRLPAHLEEHQNGQLARELTYEVRTGGVADSLFMIPAGYTVLAPGAGHMGHHGGGMTGEPLRAIGRGVFVDDRSGAMVVEFRDHVAVFDCPNDFATSQATIDAIRDKLDGKAVRYLVASHTHPDHCGGARPYFHAGAVVIAAQDHAGFYRRLAEAHHTLAPDPYVPAKRPPRIEPLPPRGRRVLEDGTQRVVLLNVGPSPHSEETIIALVAGEELLWQVDLFLAPMTGPVVTARPVSSWLAKEVADLGLSFGKIVDTHTGMVFSRAEFDKALQQGRARSQPR